MMKTKIKGVIEQFKAAQKQLKEISIQEAIKEAKKYADFKQVKAIMEKEAKEVKKLQKRIPVELEKLSHFVEQRKHELEAALKNVNALEVADSFQKTVRKKVGKVLEKKSAGSLKKKNKNPITAKAKPIKSESDKAQNEAQSEAQQ